MKILRTLMMFKFFWVCFLLPSAGAFTSLSDCLITQDIGKFKFDSKAAGIGSAPGFVGLTGHFQDHEDKICTGDYSNIDEIRGLPDEEAYEKVFTVEVQVTQHAGADSDKWLLHEVEDGYRDGDDSDGRLGRLSGEGVKIRDIGGSKLIYWGLGGGSYSWISGQKVIEIKYTDLQRTKPEPIEVVQAYLQKHPSTITLSDAELKSKAHDEQWIKDEMDRRLWLCDKWFEQLQLGKVEQGEVLQEAVKSMNVFLDYREKYYGMKAVDEKNTLQGYLDAKDETNIKNKLAEYKTWWSANKSGSLIGILSVYAHNTYRYISNFIKKLFSFVTSLLERLLAVFG